MMIKKTALEHVLTTVGYGEDEKAIVKKAIGTIHRMKIIMTESLKQSDGFNTKSLSTEEEFEAIEDVFTKEYWNKFLMVRVEESAKEESGCILRIIC
eukprot:740019-Ditylum_brightwellii.AAC.1